MTQKAERGSEIATVSYPNAAVLHVVGGHMVAGTLEETGLTEGRADVLSWEEILYEGPVPSDMSDEQLHDLRADVLADLWGRKHRDQIKRRLVMRARTLRNRGRNEPVVLWLDANLLGQLQLLDVFQNLDQGGAQDVKLVSPEHVRDGLMFGQVDTPELVRLFSLLEPVKPALLSLGHRAWTAFRSSDPRDIEDLRDELVEAMPVLAHAVYRLFEEFPWTTDGLSRSERRTLSLISSGPTSVLDIFREHLLREDRPFTTEEVVHAQLARLAGGASPLVARSDGGDFFTGSFRANHQELVLTEIGRAVLAGEADAAKAHGIDRWLGGVRLTSQAELWRWDPDARRLQLSDSKG